MTGTLARLGPLVPRMPDSPKQRIAEDGLMFRCLVGSGVHGTAIGGQDDRDEMGVTVEPESYVIGHREFGHYQYRTQPEGECSGPGDLDLIVYGLRKFVALTVAGNPTVLTTLFTRDDHVEYADEFGAELRAQRGMFLSRRAVPKFLGYLRSQRDGLLGLRSGGTNNKGRASIRERYGFDCYLDDTEFLTRRGWQRYDDIPDGEAIGTVNQETGAVEFQVPTERIEKPYSGPIHHFRHRYTSCSVTPNHRMWSSPVNRGPSGRIGNGYRPEVADWAFRPADALRGGHHVRVVGGARAQEYPVSDAEISLYGCYLSEGMVGRRRNDGSASMLSMTQQVGGRLEPALTMAGSEFPMRTYTYTRNDGGRSRPCTYTVYNLANREVATRMEAQCGTGSHELHLPAWAFDLSTRQATLLLDALMSGDGTRTNGGWQVYYSMSARLAGDVQALAIIAGRRSNMWGPYASAKGIYQVMVQDPGREYETIRMQSNHRVEGVTDRRIVCFTVPNETLVTRREGRVAMHGNTKFAGHMVRLGVQGLELVTTGRITLPIPEPDLTWIRELRVGEHTLAEALDRAQALHEAIDAANTDRSPLPAVPDMDVVDRWVTSVYMRSWGYSR